ncbi:MAG: hypothetical protein V1743_07255 [Nanoarchaeota archaeon]
MEGSSYTNADLAADYECVAKALNLPKKKYEQVRNALLFYTGNVHEQYAQEGSLLGLDISGVSDQENTCLRLSFSMVRRMPLIS